MGTTIPAVWIVIVAAVAAHGPETGAHLESASTPAPAEAQASRGAAAASSGGANVAVTAEQAPLEPETDADAVGEDHAPAPRQDPEAILRATSAAYEAMSSIQADFRQELRNPLLGRTTRSAGTLYQREPDKFLMDFSDPEGDLIISDGQYFWMYFPSVDAKQVIRAPRRAQGLDLQAQFIGDVVARFDVTYHGTEQVRGRTAHVMTLDPREPLGYRRLKVWIDDEDHLVRRFELTEESGNVRHMELEDVTINPTLPDAMFQFTPPADAIVVSRG